MMLWAPPPLASAARRHSNDAVRLFAFSSVSRPVKLEPCLLGKWCPW